MSGGNIYGKGRAAGRRWKSEDVPGHFGQQRDREHLNCNIDVGFCYFDHPRLEALREDLELRNVFAVVVQALSQHAHGIAPYFRYLGKM